VRIYSFVKRLIDLALSSAGLLLLSPLLLAIAVALKLSDRGPVIYRGARAGRDGRPFLLWKFRTMVPNAERLGGSSTASDDPRITPLGQLLRRYKLDELPQLLNVFRGDMSMVGPRPQVLDEVDAYTEEERELLTVRPGITDYASVLFRHEGEILRGHPDPDRAYAELIRPGKMRLGLYYVRHCSLTVDIDVLARTAAALCGFAPAVPATPEVNNETSAHTC
jgi:lipopolysaccharide/colanic/teichoic acid biosynthesis glycosyltransferase